MQNYTSNSNIAVFGHESAHPSAVADVFNASTSVSDISTLDCAIFAINPNTGIDQVTIDAWHSLDEFLIPRLVVVTHLEEDAGDFDDAVLIANRVFDQMVTPYLVLHDDNGLPCALISLIDMTVTDYSKSPAVQQPCEPEHETLVQEFRDEYLELKTSMGDGAFAAGVLFPAIPLWIECTIGIDIVNSYLNQLQK